MVRFNCPTCGRERVATIRPAGATEGYFCVTCGESVSAADVTTPDDALTHRDHVALGKTSEPANPDPRVEAPAVEDGE